MDKELYQRIREIFHEVCDLSERDRASKLDELCKDEPETRAGVEQILQAEESESESDPAVPQFSYSQTAPELDGYRIIALIGEGGMGAVYEAEQLNPSRSVAIKVLRSGYATRVMLKRFQREAEVLARLNHQGIAQIYEVGLGGSDDRGVPFIAMELVRGDTLLRAADAAGLDLHERLELAAELCDAVDHAHTRGVIHRDLKPSNILISESGAPKILDFGIARITERDLQAVTMQTEVGQILGTAAYMSPEQASGDPEEIDERCDVYALGAVIYELLTGRLPHDVSSLSLPEALQSIRLDDPTSAATLDTRFRGDINTILNKALERDKDHRYQSAAELGADIRRHLESKPIHARPPSVLYQCQKFAKRNKGVVAALATVFLLLIFGLIVLGAAFQRESRARVEAEESLARANSAYTFLEQILLGLSPRETKNMDTELLMTMLDHANGEADLIEQRAVRAEMLFIIARAYHSIFEYDRAAETMSEAIALYEQYPSDPDVMLDALETLSHAHHKAGRFDQAATVMDSVIASARASRDSERLAGALRKQSEIAMDVGNYTSALTMIKEARSDETRVSEMDRARSEMQHAAILRRLDRIDEAEPLYLQALERFQAEGADLEVPILLNSLAVIARRRGDYDKAERYYTESIAVRESIDSRVNPEVATTLSNLGRLFVLQGRYDEALEVLDESLAQHIELYGEDHLNIAYPLVSLAQTQRELKRLDEAMESIERAISTIENEVASGHPLLAYARMERISVLRDAGRVDDAIESTKLAIDALRSGKDGVSAHLGALWMLLAELYQIQDASSESLQIDALRNAMLHYRPESPDYNEARSRLEQLDKESNP